MITEMKYNTQEKRLTLPEYGRNIQHMVDFCVTIADREERSRCANAIINIMGNMFPHLRDVNDFKHILWDHLAIMADFSLDIDYPYEVVKKENLYIKPAKLPYPQGKIVYKHYGKSLEKMIRKAVNYEDGEQKEYLIGLLANHMKKSFLTWNKEVVDDRKIFDDLEQLSKGNIVLDEEQHKLTESKDILFKKNKNLSRRQNK
ncbi:MAG: hypothetical protein EZS26_001684 [Candidatus Ordinivivax streblomastigis]|jgi:hypothetical protein|uniref:DUF4290 domain-containing protein n=1 Tax=Candidatus Ordinivivax streblomastigis TaxID=2540710 RepID=A0A5M8P0X1_9BACT|nr:MAG: hypothetical protein EZS26_001684 [Candidatus Ordinivivax streblomastigis]